MKKLIVDNLSEQFAQLQQEREAARERVQTLSVRLQEHLKRIADHEETIRRLESEISETVSAGGDPAALLRKLRSSRDALGDLRSVVELAERAVELAKAGEDQHAKKMSELYQETVISARNTVAESLQAELNDIINRIDEWRDVAFRTAGELDLPAPAAGTEIVLTSLR